MRLFIIIVALLATTSSVRADNINTDTYGCYLKEDIERVRSIDQNGQLLSALINRGRCLPLKKWDTVLVEKHDTLAGITFYTCVIPAGEVRCLWIGALYVNK